MMALADYYLRNAVAASQILAGFDDQRIREVLGAARVGVAIGTDATNCREGRALLDLLVRLLARLYPTIAFRCDAAAQGAAVELMDLASRINPKIEFSRDPAVEIAVGTALPGAEGCPRFFAGSDGWNSLGGTTGAVRVGDSENPFGAGVSACLAAANLFRRVFQGEEAALDRDLIVSVLDAEPRQGGDAALVGSIGEVVLVGVGAIGNGAAWALSRVPMEGILRLVDHQTVDLGNLQRYVLAERGDEGGWKVDVVARYFNAGIRAKAHTLEFAEFAKAEGYVWPRMLLALDSSRDRRAAQASLPGWIANAWTQPGDLGVSSHDFRRGACVTCLYLPEHALENEDAIIATALGIPDQLMNIRVLLHNGAGVPRGMLDAIAAARGLPIERLLPFEGRPVRTLYTEGFCGGAVIPLGGAGMPRQDVHVPLAHQSALAGLLLAAAAVRQALGLSRAGTQVTRVDVMSPLGICLTQPAGKDPRGICICQDTDYREAFERKYPSDLRENGKPFLLEKGKG